MVRTAAIIGAGTDPDDPGRDGFGMGYRHGRAYREIDSLELVACADIVIENAERFAEEFDVESIYEDYQEMLREVRPDIVSVCVPPAAHAELVVGCAESGDVQAIHCEKPMAQTWAQCREMVSVADTQDVQLTFNHQRRFGTLFRKAKEFVDDGTLGSLKRVEFATDNLYDAGSHTFDLANYFLDQRSIEWVLGGIDYREENVWFGAHNENQGLVQWRYDNGVHGLATTGWGKDGVGCYMRLLGEEGTVEMGVENGPALRIRRNGTGWTEVDTAGEDIHGVTSQGVVREGLKLVADRLPGVPGSRLARPTIQYRALKDVVDAARNDFDSELKGSNALDATELIFAAWESARRRGRVDLPLDIDDNPLESMVQEGHLLPTA